MSSLGFRTEQVTLRAFEPADAASLHAYLNDPALAGRRYLPDGFPDAAPLSIRQVEGVVEHWQKETESWTLAVLENASGELVGHVRADWEWDPHCPSACVVIAPPHQRRGMGTAALAMAVAFLFEETPAHVVSAWMASWNEPALAFARANGFAEAGRRPRGGVHGGAYYSEVAFDLLRTEWTSEEGSHRAA
jgi:RimJ/RimL family protein N-acetyltransferase